jgi:hypothetical protein
MEPPSISFPFLNGLPNIVVVIHLHTVPCFHSLFTSPCISE